MHSHILLNAHSKNAIILLPEYTQEILKYTNTVHHMIVIIVKNICIMYMLAVNNNVPYEKITHPKT